MITSKRCKRLLKAYEEMEENYERFRKALVEPNLKLDQRERAGRYKKVKEAVK